MCKEEIYINMNISFLVSKFLIFVCGIHTLKFYYRISSFYDKAYKTGFDDEIDILKGDKEYGK